MLDAARVIGEWGTHHCHPINITTCFVRKYTFCSIANDADNKIDFCTRIGSSSCGVCVCDDGDDAKSPVDQYARNVTFIIITIYYADGCKISTN